MLEAVCWLIRQELIREINRDGTAERFEAFNHHFAVHGGDDGHQLFDSLGIPHGRFLPFDSLRSGQACSREPILARLILKPNSRQNAQMKTSNTDPLRAGSGGLTISFNFGAGGAIFSHGSTLHGG